MDRIISPRQFGPPEAPKLSSENSSAATPKAVGWFHDWACDILVAAGFLLLIIGLIIPLISDRREIAIFAPLGSAAIGVGVYKSRQKNNFPP